MKPLAEGQNTIYYSSIAYSPKFVTLYEALLGDWYMQNYY